MGSGRTALEGVDPGEYGFVRATVHGFILNDIFYTAVFVLGFVSLINSLTSGKKYGGVCVPFIVTVGFQQTAAHNA